jgi:DHA1 family tetracycline resistance protein-like MFS transporter
MSRHVSGRAQGQLQGANNSITGVANLAGPGLFTQVFAVAIGSAVAWAPPGAPFLFAAAMLMAATGVVWSATRAR